MLLRLSMLFAIAFGLLACGDASLPTDKVDSLACDPSAPATRTISCVDSFAPGPGAGFGQDDFPSIIYGDPKGTGNHQGSVDVLSLGMGGEIVVGFGGGTIVDGDGVDFIVFENAFDIGGNPMRPWTDLAEVSVSEDGATWTTFPCETKAFPFTSCAGWHPVYANDADGISPFDPKVAGGDQFDLKDIGVGSARLIRIRDRGENAAPPNAGFDLDAAAIIHASP